jgi:hypothetical protein
MLHTFAAGTANYSTQSIGFEQHAKRSGFEYWPGDPTALIASARSSAWADLHYLMDAASF